MTDGTAAWGGGERWREWFFDPATGALLGSRVWGDLGEGRVNLLPFVYRLHYQLALGDVGMLLMGLVALAWTLDCFIGLYLTFPARRQQPVAQDRRSWWARWKPSWLVQGGSLFAGLFSFHRAVGLWVWPLLLVLAWSSVGFNLSPVFRPVMDVLGTAPDPWSDHPELTPPRVVPALPLAAALLRGETLLAERTIARGGAVVRPQSLSYDPESGLYEYRALTTLDLAQDYGRTRVWFDGDQGAFQGFYAPTGLAPGDTAESWLFALHMGRVGGWPYRLLLAVTGLMVAGLCVTGVMLWWRKRRIRRAHRNPASSAFSSPAPSTP